ncbi:AP-2 complex subunit sigma [Termitomyces sp. T32_za158]|nr:AP-2 complex subunit sigma [Termitomyces sp. T32_za158]
MTHLLKRRYGTLAKTLIDEFPVRPHWTKNNRDIFRQAVKNLDQDVRLRGEVHRLVAPRDQKYQSNFVEFRNYKIVYRRYAGLFFCLCVDANDNELAYLEAIHLFVEILDSFFDNVCELDLVFNFYKVYAILDEIFLAGEIEETSKDVVLSRLEQLEKLE